MAHKKTIMIYKEAIIAASDELAKNPKSIFLGYNVKKGKANGTFKNIPENQLFETPVAENLMLGIATGLSLEGRIPVVYIERFDFILNALDAIVNHLEKINPMSQGEFKPAVIIKVAIGIKNKPLYSGMTHTQDFTEAMTKLLSFPVIKLEKDANHIRKVYKTAESLMELGQSFMIIEEKELYDEQV